MKHLFLSVLAILMVASASADEHRCYEYEVTAYNAEGGGLTSNKVEYEGRLLGSSPVLSISSDKKVIWVKAGSFEGRFIRGEDSSNGMYYYYDEVVTSEEETLSSIFSMFYEETTHERLIERSVIICMDFNLLSFQIGYRYKDYFRHDFYDFSHSASAPVNNKRREYEQMQSQSPASSRPSAPASSRPSAGSSGSASARTEAEPPTSGPYKVGDYYNENGRKGVVFEVSDGGRHGKIVSLTESEEDTWSEKLDGSHGFRLTDRSNGWNNQQKIMCLDGWRDIFTAFAWCADQGEGWYLPAIEELEALFLNDSVREAVSLTLQAKGYKKLWGRKSGASYWSSTANSTSSSAMVWAVYMISGGSEETYSTVANSVRAVATF